MQAANWAGPSQHNAPPAMPLGNVLAQHKGRLELRDIMPIGGVLLVLLGLGGGASTLPSVIDGSEPVTSLTFVPILLVLGALLLWRTARQMGQRLDVHERGFVYTIGGRQQSVAWGDVTGQRAVRVIGPNGTEKGFRLVLALRDGRHLTFTTWLTNVHGLHAHVSSFVPAF